MSKAAELRSEAERLRGLALTQADPAVLREIKAMIKELESRAHELDNGEGAN